MPLQNEAMPRVRNVHYFCQIMGMSKPTFMKLWRANPEMGLWKDSPNGDIRGDVEVFDIWYRDYRKRSSEAFHAQHRGMGGVFPYPDKLLRADAADHLRQIMRLGEEPDESTHWRNCAMLRGDVPPDIRAGLQLPEGCSWEGAVRRAELLLSLDPGTKARTLTLVHRRLNEFYAAAEATDAFNEEAVS